LYLAGVAHVSAPGCIVAAGQVRYDRYDRLAVYHPQLRICKLL